MGKHFLKGNEFFLLKCLRGFSLDEILTGSRFRDFPVRRKVKGYTAHSHIHTHTLTHTLTHRHTLTLLHSLTHTHTPAHTHSLSRTHTLTHIHTHSRMNTHTYTNWLSHPEGCLDGSLAGMFKHFAGFVCVSVLVCVSVCWCVCVCVCVCVYEV